jgi:peroxiredoxin
MYPHERSLVKRMRGRPFAFLGINSDDSDTAAPVAAKEGLDWRSWRDGGQVYGGRIARRWNVQALPTTYILDHRGVIRHKIEPRADGHDPAAHVLDDRGRARDKWQLRAEEISAIVDRLVEEVEASQARSEPLPETATRIEAPR